MKVINRQAQALKSSMTPEELGKAMSQLNLNDIPKERRAEAIRDHLARIAADVIHDREKASEIRSGLILKSAGIR